jgi:hypothetical protein
MAAATKITLGKAMKIRLGPVSRMNEAGSALSDSVSLEIAAFLRKRRPSFVRDRPASDVTGTGSSDANAIDAGEHR